MPIIYILLIILLSSCVNDKTSTKEQVRYFLNINEKLYYKNIEKELFTKEINQKENTLLNKPVYKVIYDGKIIKKAILYDKYKQIKSKYILTYTKKQKINTISIINNKKALLNKKLFQDNFLIKELSIYPQNKNKNENLTIKQTKVFIKVNNPHNKTILRYIEKYKNNKHKEIIYYRYFINNNKLKQVEDKIEIWKDNKIIRQISHEYSDQAQKIETTVYKQNKITAKIFYNKYQKIKEKWDYINKNTIYYDNEGNIIKISPLNIKKEEYYEASP